MHAYICWRRVKEAVPYFHLAILPVLDRSLVRHGRRLLADFEDTEVLAAGNDQVAAHLDFWGLEGDMGLWERVDC